MGFKKWNRYYFIKDSYNINQQLGSGLNLYIFLPSDPDDLLDQLKLLYFEKVGGNDNRQLIEQIMTIADKLLEYECITTNQQQNIQSNFKKDPFVD